MTVTIPHPTYPSYHCPEYRTLNYFCEGDRQGLSEALGTDYVVLHEIYDDSEGYGHHSANAVFRTKDNKYIHAECGGCSCEGSGSWGYCKDAEEAYRMIPENLRPDHKPA